MGQPPATEPQKQAPATRMPQVDPSIPISNRNEVQRINNIPVSLIIYSYYVGPKDNREERITGITVKGKHRETHNPTDEPKDIPQSIGNLDEQEALKNRLLSIYAVHNIPREKINFR